MGHSFISNAFLLFLVQNFLLRNQVLQRFPKNPKEKTKPQTKFHSLQLGTVLTLKCAALKRFCVFVLLHKVTLYKMYKFWFGLY